MRKDFQLGPWTVHPERHSLSRQNDLRRLSHKAMAVLLCLAEQPGQVLSKEVLIQRVWDGAFTSDEALATVIYELRRALGDRAAKPRYIETIRKSGYRLLQSIVALAEDRDASDLAAITEPRDAPSPSPRRPSPRRRRRIAGIGAAAALLAGIGVWLLMPTAPQEASDVRSLAVMPLTSLGAEPEQELFANALTTMLTADLAHLGSFEVLSTPTNEQDADGPPPYLTADTVLEGLIQSSGDQLWLSVNLVEALTGRVLWGGTYERRGKDLPRLQRELAIEISHQVRKRLQSAPQSRPIELAALDPQVSEAFQLGQHFLEQRTPESQDKALQYFHLAIELEPSFAPAHVGLANTYLAAAEALPTPSKAEAYRQATAAVETALAIDDELPEAHVSRASIYFQHEWDWQLAAEHFELGYEPRLCSIEDSHHYARYLSAMGHHDEAIATMKLCVESDPASKIGQWTLAWVYYMARRFDDALAVLERLEELDPGFAPMCRLQGDVLFAKGEHAAALRAQQRVMELSGEKPQNIAELGQAFVAEGIDGAYRWLLSRAIEDATQDPVDPVRLASLEARRGSSEAALTWLEQAFAERHADLVWIKVDPAFDSLRDTRRFRALLARLELGI